MLLYKQSLYFYFYDQEWMEENIPIKFILYSKCWKQSICEKQMCVLLFSVCSLLPLCGIIMHGGNYGD